MNVQDCHYLLIEFFTWVPLEVFNHIDTANLLKPLVELVATENVLF
jgi:hypothetical protein